MDKAIKLWLYPIAYTQLLLTLKKSTCIEPTEEEDLSLVTNVEELISTMIDDETQQDKLYDKLAILNAAMAGLSEKHRIIYLTYKAYRPNGNNIPRSVSKKLREKLELTQNSIGVYKMQAELQINQYLARHHENK